MIKCKACGFEHHNESDAALHHIFPKALGGTDKDGRMYLCHVAKGNDCHRKLHEWLNPLLKKEAVRLTNIWLNQVIENVKHTREIEKGGVQICSNKEGQQISDGREMADNK